MEGRGEQANRRGRTLALLCAALAALAIAYFAVLALSADDDTADAETPLLSDVESARVTQISIYASDESLSLVRENGSWLLSDDPDESLDQDAVGSLVDAAVSATYSRVIEADQISADMGLDDPSAEIELSVGDEAITISFGIETSDGSARYVRLSTGDEAYLVDATLLDTFSVSANDLFEQESGPGALSTTFTSFLIERADGTLALARTEETDDEGSTTATWTADDGSGAVEIDSSEAVALVNLVNNVSWTSCVTTADDGATDYGFASPTVRVTFEYATETAVETGEVDEDGDAVYETRVDEYEYVLVIGAQAEDGSYYAQPEGSSAVYTLSADDVAELIGATAAGLMATDA